MKNKLIERLTNTNIFKNNKTFILRWYVKIRSGLHTIFTLHDGTDAEGTIAGIKNNVQLRGANIWILICAAGLASIGLDVNSAAVIIGAMLISPLMSPILGIGLAVGINDRSLLIDSLKNFGIAVAASIGASAIYFFLTPLGEATPELAARTSPTLLDVGVALFGGIAGIVAGSRKEKNKRHSRRCYRYSTYASALHGRLWHCHRELGILFRSILSFLLSMLSLSAFPLIW